MKKTLSACWLFFAITLTVFFATPSGAEASPSDGVGIKKLYKDGSYQRIFVLKEDDSLWGWGSNESGKLGIGSDHIDENILLPVRIMTGVEYFDGSSAVIKKDGSLWMWDKYLSVCSGNTGVPVKVMDGVEQIWQESAGDNVFILREDKSLWGWGDLVSGSSGDGGYKPVKIMDSAEKVVDILGYKAVFVRKQDKSLWGLGPSVSGSRGENGYEPIKMLDSVKDYFLVGESMYSAITEDGGLYSWGSGWDGCLGAGDGYSSDTPVRVMGGVSQFQYSRDSYSNSAFFALKTDGTLWHWGSYASLLCGQKDSSGRISAPVQILDQVQSLCIPGGNDALVLKQDSSLWGWGSGRLELPCHDDQGNQTPIKLLDDVDRIETDKGYAIKKDGSLWASGYYVCAGMYATSSGNGYVEMLDHVVRAYDKYALQADGSLYMWLDYEWQENQRVGDPYEGYGQYYEAPCYFLGHVKYFTDEGGLYAAITEDDELTVWGYNYDRIGTGINEEFTTHPIFVLQNIKSFEGFYTQSCYAIGTDGRLLATGRNSVGQLGLGDTDDRNVFVEVSDFSNSLIPGDDPGEPGEEYTGFRIPQDTNHFGHVYSDFFNYEKKSVSDLSLGEKALYKIYVKKNRAIYVDDVVLAITDEHAAKEPGGFTYHTSKNHMDRLTAGLNRAERQLIVNKENGLWKGSCHGIAVSMALASQGLLGKDAGINGDYYHSGKPKDKALLRNTINFYQLSQFLTKGMPTEATHTNPWCISPYDPELGPFLRDLVNETQRAVNRKKPIIFGYHYYHNDKDEGHSIVIYGLIRHTMSQYTILMYDENDAQDKVPVRVSVNLANETFSFTDGNGTYVDQDNYISLNYTGLDDLYGTIGLLSDDDETEEEGALLSLSAGSKCVITNERGEYISYDGESYSGTMQVYSQRLVGGDRNPEMLLRVEPYESLTVTDLDSEMDLSAEVDGEYYTVAVDGADQISISENEISLDGEDYSFTGGTSAVGSGDRLYKVSSDAQGDVNLKAEDGALSVTSDEELENTVVSALSDASAEHQDVPDGAKQVDIDTAAAGEEIVFDSDVQAVGLDQCDVSISPVKYTYSGKACKPAVTVLYGDSTLMEGLDYTVSYKNNVNAGTACVTVKGIRNFAGSKDCRYTINKAAGRITKVTASKKIKYARLKKKTQTFKIAATTAGKAGKSFKLKSVPKKAKKYIRVSSAGKVTVKKGLKKGTYRIKVQITARETSNYKKKTLTKTIRIIVR